MIQEEKQSTEARAEELESRVGSIEHMNLLVRGRPSDKQSPELSGRSSPSSPNRDFMHKYGVSAYKNELLIEKFVTKINLYCISYGNLFHTRIKSSVKISDANRSRVYGYI